MHMTMIVSLFALFSGVEDTESYQPLLTAAVQEVTGQLQRKEDAGEVRLCYLAAAIANLHFTQLHGAREKALATYAGTVTRQSDSTQQLRFAEQLVTSYRRLCRDLLKDESFRFIGCGGYCHA